MDKILKEMEDRFGQLIALIWVFLHKLLPLGLTVSQVQDLIKNKEHPFWVAFDEATKLLVSPSIVSDQVLKDWKNFYKKFFGLNLDLSGIKIPAQVPGFNRLLIIAKGISINRVYETGKKSFSSWKWCDVDIESAIQASERGEVKETYAIWVRDEQEADKDLLGKSAEDIKNPQDTESLLERLLHGFKYWSETETHLDVKTYTLCASSRYSDGSVPYVNRDDDGDVSVGGYDPQDRDADIGARRAVRVIG